MRKKLIIFIFALIAILSICFLFRNKILEWTYLIIYTNRYNKVESVETAVNYSKEQQVLE